RGALDPPLHRLLPDRARRGGCGPALRRVRAHDGPRAAPQDPLRRRDRDQGAGAAPAQGGVRLRDGLRGGAFAVPDEPRARPGVADADGRPERGGGGVDRPVPDQGPQAVAVPPARAAADLPRHVRGGHAEGCGRPQRGRGPHHRPRGHRAAGPRGAAEAVRPLQERHRGTAAGSPGREPTRPREAGLQRGQPGHPGEGAGHQRGLGRVQQGGPQGQGGGRAGRARRRRLRARAGQQRRGRRQALRRRLRGISQGAGGDQEAHLPGDAGGVVAEAQEEGDPRREGPGDPALPAARGEGRRAEAMTTTLRAAAVVLGLVILYASVYTVSETEQVIVTQFGKPVGGPITAAGLHVKVPFIQTLHRFDKRWLEFDGDPNQIPTKDKKYIWVETYARWRIADPLRFYQAVTDERGGQSRLDDVVDGQTRNAVASYDLIEIVRSSNRPFQVTEELEGIGSAEALTKIEVGREKIAQVILKKAAEITPQFGIELEDVRFKRLNYIDTVQQKVFERMISERRRIAERSRSAGQGRAAEIRGQKERDILAASSL